MATNEKVRIQGTIGKSMLGRLEVQCEEFGISKSAGIAIAIDAWIKNVEDRCQMAGIEKN